MKNKKAFAPIMIITIILSVALFGAIGYIFWNNMNGSSKSDTNKTPENKVALKTYAANSSKLGYNFGFEYPSDWTLIEKINDSKEQRMITMLDGSQSGVNTPYLEIRVSSPSLKTQVYYLVGYQGGIGGTCSPDDFPELGRLEDVSSIRTRNLINNEKTAYLTELKFTKNNKVTKSKTYLTTKGDWKNNDSFCSEGDGPLSNFIRLSPSTEIGMSMSTIYDSQILLSDIQNSDGTIKSNITSQNVTDARSTEEYKQARDILLSTTYSKL